MITRALSKLKHLAKEAQNHLGVLIFTFLNRYAHTKIKHDYSSNVTSFWQFLYFGQPNQGVYYKYLMPGRGTISASDVMWHTSAWGACSEKCGGGQYFISVFSISILFPLPLPLPFTFPFPFIFPVPIPLKFSFPFTFPFLFQFTFPFSLSNYIYNYTYISVYTFISIYLFISIFFFFFFLIILFIFLIQDSLQADLEFKLQSIASYRKTDYKSIWKKNKNKNKRNYRL